MSNGIELDDAGVHIQSFAFSRDDQCFFPQMVTEARSTNPTIGEKRILLIEPSNRGFLRRMFDSALELVSDREANKRSKTGALAVSVVSNQVLFDALAGQNLNPLSDPPSLVGSSGLNEEATLAIVSAESFDEFAGGLVADNQRRVDLMADAAAIIDDGARILEENE